MDLKSLFVEYEDGRRRIKEYPSFGFLPRLIQTKRARLKSDLPYGNLIRDGLKGNLKKRNNGGIKKMRRLSRHSKTQQFHPPSVRANDIEEVERALAFIERATTTPVSRASRTMNIIVDQAPGSTLCLIMQDTCTIRDVKLEIEKRVGTPCKIQRLRHRGCAVKDSDPLSLLGEGFTDLKLMLFEGYLRGGGIFWGRFWHRSNSTAPPTDEGNSLQAANGNGNKEGAAVQEEVTMEANIQAANGAASAEASIRSMAHNENHENVCAEFEDNCKRLSNIDFLSEYLPCIKFSEGITDPNVKKFCLKHIFGRKGQNANQIENKLSFLVLYDTQKVSLDGDMRERIWREVIQKHTKDWVDLLSLEKEQGRAITEDDNAVVLGEHPVELRLDTTDDASMPQVKVVRLEDLERLEDSTVVLLVDDSVARSNMKGYFPTLKSGKGFITFKGQFKTMYHAKMSIAEDGILVSFGDLMKPGNFRKQTLPTRDPVNTEFPICEPIGLQTTPKEECSYQLKKSVKEPKELSERRSNLSFLENNFSHMTFSEVGQRPETKQFCLRYIFGRKGPKANDLERKFTFLFLHDPLKVVVDDDMGKRIWTDVIQKHTVDWIHLLTDDQKRGWSISDCDNMVCIDGNPVEFTIGNANKNSKCHVRALPLEDMSEGQEGIVVLLVDESAVASGMKGYFSTLKNGTDFVTFDGQGKACYHACISITDNEMNVSFGDLLEHLQVSTPMQEPSATVRNPQMCKPRKFKAIATESFRYTEGSVFGCRESGDEGNLLTPAHEFKLFTDAVKTPAFFQKFGKEVLKFACACLNSRKNGTIHFGIADENCQMASKYKLDTCQVVGVPVLDKTLYKDKLTTYINNYFDEENRDFARMCICKPEFVEVEPSSAQATATYVIEVDIEASYEYTHGKIFSVALPQLSNVRKAAKSYEPFIRNGSQSSTLSDISYESYRKNMERIDSKRKQEELQLGKKSQNMTWQLRNILGEDCGKLNNTFKRILVLSFMDASILTAEFLQKASFISNVPWSFVIDLNSSDKSEAGLCQSITDKTDFEIHDAQEFNTDRSKKKPIPTSWVFGNGSGRRSLPLSWAEWQLSDQARGVHALIEKANNEYPSNRTIILFVIKPGFSKIEVMIYYWFLFHFQKNAVCFYIEDEQTEMDWQEHVVNENEYIDKHKFVSQGILGLPWDEFVEEIKNLTIECQSGTIKVPMNRDTLMSMQRGHFNDRSVLLMDSKECSHLQKLYKDDKQKYIRMKRDAEQLFYRGQEVSMENLWFTQIGAKQVIERDVLVELKSCFRHILSGDPDISQSVETIRILHSRGSGGTTVGKHFLWTLFYQGPPYEARCCIVSDIKQETIDTIYNFWNYKNSAKLPVVVLIDDHQDSDFQILIKGLSERMESNGTCVILLRVEPCSDPEAEALQDDRTKCVTLDFHLREDEQLRFHEKYEEMQRELGECFKEYEKTLISFMMMMHRTQGDREQYAHRIVKSAFGPNDLSDDERDLLTFLSLIRVSVIEDKYIYVAAFDPIMSSFNFRKARFNSDWTCSISMNAKMFLRFKDIPVSDDAYDQPERGVTIIFDDFAEAILGWAKDSEEKTIGDVALDLMKSQAFPSSTEVPRMNESLRCLYFKMYLALQNKKKLTKTDEKRELFSKLIIRILYEGGTVSKVNLDKALELMQMGFEKMDRPVLAQQVARLCYIHGYVMEEEIEAYFENAVKWVQKALAKRKDSHFLDTAGRIRLSKLQVLYPRSGQFNRHSKRYDAEDCMDALDLCLASIKWFKESQRAADIRKTLNIVSYMGEMQAMLYFASIVSSSIVFKDNQQLVQKYFSHPSWKPQMVPWSQEHDTTLKSFRNRYLHCLRTVDEIRSILKTEDEIDNDLTDRLDDEFKQFFVYYSGEELSNDRGRWKENCMFIESHTGGSILKNIFTPKRMKGKSKKSYDQVRNDLSEIQKRLEENLNLDVDERSSLEDIFLLTVVKIASYSPFRKLPIKKKYAIKEFQETKSNTETLLQREERMSGKLKNYCLLFCSMFQWPHTEPELRTDKGWFKRFNETLEKLRSMSTTLQQTYQKPAIDTGEEFCRRQGLKLHPRYIAVTTLFYLGKGQGLDMYVHANELHDVIKPKKGQGINWDHHYIEYRLQQLSGERVSVSTIEFTTVDQEVLEIEVAGHWRDRYSLEEVTFYVGFSWKGPLAHGVKVKRDCDTP